MTTIRLADRLEDLLDPLLAIMSAPLEDPLQPETIVVPNRGVRIWLNSQLMRRLGAGPDGDGVVANVELPFPGALVGPLLGDAADRWNLDRLVWAVLAELQAAAAENPPLLRPVTTPPMAGTWYGRARRVADLFDRYTSTRPEMIRSWLTAEEPAVPESARWQPELFRRVRERIDAPCAPELLGGDGASVPLPDLPPRMIVFGLNAISPVVARALPRIAAATDLHLLLLTPSVPLTLATAEDAAHRVGVGSGVEAIPRKDVLSRPSAAVLPGWSVPAQETAILLGVTEGVRFEAPAPEVSPVGKSLLERFQEAIRTNTPVPVGVQPVTDEVAVGDHSIQFHACHGPSRQVEVLRDALLHRLAADPTLRPEDILVVCPDLETYAPLIDAVLPHGGVTVDRPEGPSEALPYRIVHRPGAVDRPLIDGLLTLLGLPDGRFTATELRTVLSLPAVALRFGFTDDDLTRFADWLERSAVRWGRDAEDRARFSISSFEAHTWADGLRRLLMGVLVEADSGHLAFGGIAPVDLEGSDAELLGRLVDAVEAIGGVCASLQSAAPPAAWRERLIAVVDRLLAEPPGQDRERRQVVEVVDGFTGDAAGFGVGDIALREIRAHLLERLGAARRPTRGTEGRVLIGPPSVLRSVPARIMAVLGLDGDVLGGGAGAMDDLTLASPAVGDRDPRAEGRQMLLDALLAAGDAVIITHDGMNVVTNSPVPPPVVLEELSEAVAAFGTPLRITHPRHARDARCFIPGRITGPGPWSFDRAALRAALAAARRSGAAPEPARAITPLTPAAEPVVEIEDLLAFLNHPVRAFLRNAGMTFPRDRRVEEDLHPLELNHLAAFVLGQLILDGEIPAEGDPQLPADFLEVQRAAGVVPVGRLGEAAEFALLAKCNEPIGKARKAGLPISEQRTEQDVDVELPDGRRLRGRVAGIAPTLPGPLILRAAASNPKPLLRIAVEVAALTLLHPEAMWCGAVADTKRVEQRWVRGATGEERRSSAAGLLADLVDLRDRGLRQPLPLFLKSSAPNGGNSTWLASSPDVPGERDEPEHRAFWPGADDVTVIEGFSECRRALWGAIDRALTDEGPGLPADREATR